MQSRRLYPSIASLCAFEAVARKGSFTAAALELSLTQGAISRQVNALEEQLKCRLLVRTTRSLTLTQIGRKYLSNIEPALSKIRNASLDAMTDSQKRIATIALLPTFGSRWLMPRMPGFLQEHPDVTLRFTTKIGRFDFHTEAIDGAIYHGPKDWPEADLSLLMTEDIIPVASRDFLRTTPINTLRDFLSVPKLLMQSRPHDWQDWQEAHDMDNDPSSDLDFEHFSMVTQACMAGLGIALMPKFLIAPELAQGGLVAIGNSIQSRGAYYFATPKGTEPNAVTREFRDWIVAQARNLPDLERDKLPPNTK